MSPNMQKFLSKAEVLIERFHIYRDLTGKLLS